MEAQSAQVQVLARQEETQVEAQSAQVQVLASQDRQETQGCLLLNTECTRVSPPPSSHRAGTSLGGTSRIESHTSVAGTPCTAPGAAAAAALAALWAASLRGLPTLGGGRGTSLQKKPANLQMGSRHQRRGDRDRHDDDDWDRAAVATATANSTRRRTANATAPTTGTSLHSHSLARFADQKRFQHQHQRVHQSETKSSRIKRIPKLRQH